MGKLILLALVSLFQILVVRGQCPTFVTRNVWGARSVGGIGVMPIRPVPLVIVHQTGTEFCTRQSQCSQIVRTLQAFHIDVNGWPDLSFHFLIGEDNLIYTGRGWTQRGENVNQFNNQAINIAYIGNFNNRMPSTTTRALLDSFIQCGITAGHLTSTVSVIASCQVNVQNCSSNTIFEFISAHPRYNSTPRPV
ncbi:unnamed protein product [Diamesa serratosioi]